MATVGSSGSRSSVLDVIIPREIEPFTHSVWYEKCLKV